LFGDAFIEGSIIDPARPIIDQFPAHMTYDECQQQLCSVGLTSVPCWIRPAYTLSNGQKFRAEVAIRVAVQSDLSIIDEWTSVVDRTVAKVMSHSIQKFARKSNRKIILLSCHADVIDWLQPDWIIDCNTDQFTCRRELPRVRTEKLRFNVRQCNKLFWKMFSKYHYLSSDEPPGESTCFGLFESETNAIVGFIAYSAYIPGNRSTRHSNRLVIHPDYCGIGLGHLLSNATAKEMTRRGFRVFAKNSSKPRHVALSKDKKWKLKDSKFKTREVACQVDRKIRQNVRWCSWEYIEPPRIPRQLENEGNDDDKN
jgi:ABC-type ATPase with predicted acetyltransferase domain